MPPRTVRRYIQPWIPITVATFSPSNIAGLTAWYDASNAGSITASSGSVSQWNDLSGNGYHVTQGTGASQPTTGTRTINSRNVLDFDGSNDYLQNNSFSFNYATHTLACVVLADTAVQLCVASLSDTAGGNDYADGRTMRPLEQDSTGTSFQSYYALTLASGLVARVGGTAVQLTTVRGTNTITGRKNGVAGTATSGSGSATLSFSQSWFIGAAHAASPVVPWDGGIAEVCLYNSELTGTDLTNIESYLKTKWGTP